MSGETRRFYVYGHFCDAVEFDDTIKSAKRVLFKNRNLVAVFVRMDTSTKNRVKLTKLGTYASSQFIPIKYKTGATYDNEFYYISLRESSPIQPNNIRYSKSGKAVFGEIVSPGDMSHIQQMCYLIRDTMDVDAFVEDLEKRLNRSFRSVAKLEPLWYAPAGCKRGKIADLES
jgi:hypothetical protein